MILNKVDVKEMALYYAKRLAQNINNDRVLFSCYFRQKLALPIKGGYIPLDEKDRKCIKMRLMYIDYNKSNKIYTSSYGEAAFIASRLMAVFNINSDDIAICSLENKKEDQYQYIVRFTLTPEKFVELCKKCSGFVYDGYGDYNEKGEYIKNTKLK